MDMVTCLADYTLLKNSEPIVLDSIQLLQICVRHLIHMAEEGVEDVTSHGHKSTEHGNLNTFFTCH
jgi:hypothetical protein